MSYDFSNFRQIQDAEDEEDSKMVKILDVKWFSGRDTIGIVLVDTEYGHKCYIGTARGYNEDQDREEIASNGSRFVYGSSLWPHIKDWAQ